MIPDLRAFVVPIRRALHGLAEPLTATDQAVGGMCTVQIPCEVTALLVYRDLATTRPARAFQAFDDDAGQLGCIL